MRSTQQIVDDIIGQLKVLDPAMSAEVGTPERKIIEATAEMIANYQVDFSVLEAQHDLDTMAGGRLDAYLGNFGFARQLPTAATGTVIFARPISDPATEDIIIPQGTQIAANVSDTTLPDVIFVLLDTISLPAGSSSVTGAVQCTTPGTIGNVPPGSVVGFSLNQSITGITSVSNDTDMTGGTDGEDDAAYKVRFKNTIFRNQSGTYDQFLALAVSQSAVTKANVVGPISRYQEYIQIPTAKDVAQRTIVTTIDNTGAASSSLGGYDNVASGWTWPAKRTSVASTIPYSKYTFDQNFYVTDGGLGQDAKFFRPAVDFVFNPVPISAASGTNQIIDTASYALKQPNVTFLDAHDADDNTTGNTNLEAGAVVLLEHAYMSSASRNNYYKGILNCIDVFVNGAKPVQVSSQEVMPGSSSIVNVDSSKWNYQNNYARKISGATPSTSNKIVPLLWQPVVDVPDKVTISDGSTTYTFYRANFKNPADGKYYHDAAFNKEANFFLVEEITGYYGTIRARNGIEFRGSVNGYLPNGTQGSKAATHSSFEGQQFSAKYTYDDNISSLQAITEKHKQVTTDVLVHRAKTRYFRCFITVMYTPGVTQSVVNASINAAVAEFFNSQYYGAAIQLSDILQVIHNVSGVDNVRWQKDATGAPGTVHRIEETFQDGTAIDPPGIATQTFIDTDFFIKDSELAASPTDSPVVIQVKAQNTWGTT